MTKKDRFYIKVGHQAKKVLGDFGKLRREDLITLGVNKKLPKKDRDKFLNIAADMKTGAKKNTDWLYQKNKKTYSMIDIGE